MIVVSTGLFFKSNQTYLSVYSRFPPNSLNTRSKTCFLFTVWRCLWEQHGWRFCFSSLKTVVRHLEEDRYDTCRPTDWVIKDTFFFLLSQQMEGLTHMEGHTAQDYSTSTCLTAKWTGSAVSVQLFLRFLGTKVSIYSIKNNKPTSLEVLRVSSIDGKMSCVCFWRSHRRRIFTWNEMKIPHFLNSQHACETWIRVASV